MNLFTSKRAFAPVGLFFVSLVLVFCLSANGALSAISMETNGRTNHLGDTGEARDAPGGDAVFGTPPRSVNGTARDSSATELPYGIVPEVYLFWPPGGIPRPGGHGDGTGKGAPGGFRPPASRGAPSEGEFAPPRPGTGSGRSAPRPAWPELNPPIPGQKPPSLAPRAPASGVRR